MDLELLELQRQFQVAQEAKSNIRLSERNVVELVNTLQQLDLLDCDLLHTISGKEYITQDHLRTEMEHEIRRVGRVSLIELADVIGVDLYHVEKQAEQIVANNSELMLVQGEILSHVYWDSIVEEINERLQESSQISLAELAAQLHVSSELLSGILEPRLGTLVQGKLEGGQLYTPLHVTRMRAMICGAVRGIMVPTNLSSVWSSLQQLLREMDGETTGGSTEGILFQSLLNGLVKEGAVLGSLRAGMSWTPAVFAKAQRESVESFFSQNSFITYDVLHKLAIPQPKQYLQSKYTEGIPLETVFVHPSMIGILDAAAEDAIEHDEWLDCLSILPTSFGVQDAAKMLTLCPSVQNAQKNTTAIILADTCVVSNEFTKALFARLEKDTENFVKAKVASSQRICKDQPSNSETKPGSELGQLAKGDANEGHYGVLNGKDVSDKGAKKKKGKDASLTKVRTVENIDEHQGSKGIKGKKKQAKTKGGSSLPTMESMSSQLKGSDKVSSDEFDVLSEEWIIERLLDWHQDLEVAGAGQQETNALVRSLATLLRPMLIGSLKTKRRAILAANAENRRRSLDSLQQKLEEAYLNLQLFEKALDFFDHDPSTSVVLHRHLLRTTATEIVDMILLALDFDMKLQCGNEEEASQNIEYGSLSSGQRLSLAKGLLGSLSGKAFQMVEALEGKNVDSFNKALREVAEESGLWLKKLDKKMERTLLHSYRKSLTSQIEEESDPVALLPKVVALLYVQVHNKALQAPGRAMSVAVSCLQNGIPEMAYTTLMEYHSATVALLALLSTTNSNDGDYKSDRILSQQILLKDRMAQLKALVSIVPSGTKVATSHS